MKILVGNKGCVDFDAPISMTEEQREKFVTFMKYMFAVVEEGYIEEHRTDRIGNKFFMGRRWSRAEYTLLFQIDSESNYELAKMLGRTEMSIHIRRGLFIPIFLSWLREKNVDLLTADVAALVKKFMKEREDQIINRREKRRELRDLKKQYESMVSGARFRILQMYQTLGDTKNVKRFNRLKSKIRTRIEALERELS